MSTDTSPPREFGTPVAGAKYVLRKGSYAIIRRSTGEIAVVITPCGCFLPGGGQNPGETPQQAAIREAAEECGLRIQIGSRIGVADELVYSAGEQTYFRKRCSFFLAEVIDANASRGEPDHVLSWLTPDEAVRQLCHESQQWAVRSVG